MESVAQLFCSSAGTFSKPVFFSGSDTLRKTDAGLKALHAGRCRLADETRGYEGWRRHQAQPLQPAVRRRFEPRSISRARRKLAAASTRRPRAR